MSSGEWFSLKDKKVQKISLQPEGMESCKFVVEIIVKLLLFFFVIYNFIFCAKCRLFSRIHNHKINPLNKRQILYRLSIDMVTTLINRNKMRLVFFLFC